MVGADRRDLTSVHALEGKPLITANIKVTKVLLESAPKVLVRRHRAPNRGLSSGGLSAFRQHLTIFGPGEDELINGSPACLPSNAQRYNFQLSKKELNEECFDRVTV